MTSPGGSAGEDGQGLTPLPPRGAAWRRQWFTMRTLIIGTLTLCSLLPLGNAGAAKAPQGGLTADQVLRRAEQRFQEIQDYECRADSENYLKAPPSRGSYRIWHKKPNMLRIQVTGG